MTDEPMVERLAECARCRSTDLSDSGWYGADDKRTKGHAPDDRWTRWCRNCGAEVGR